MPDTKPPRLIAVESCPPPVRLEQVAVRDHVARHFDGRLEDVDRLLGVFDRAGIDSRSFCVPLAWFEQERSFEEKNAQFLESATELSLAAVTNLLNRVDVSPECIDHLLFVCTTGLATPGVDARLVNLVPFAPTVRRHPIFGLGCAGGTLGMMQAADLLRGQPDGLALLLNVELCTLTFHFRDFSKSNLVATALFSDGVTATLLAGGDTSLAGPEVIVTDSYLWPDTLDVMGWNFQNEGMQVVFSERIPALVRRSAKDCMDRFLGEAGLSLDDIQHVLVHPGGPRVMEAYQEALDLESARVDLSREVLRKHGNCSSATVMLVLEEFLRLKEAKNGDKALLTALGPGFNAGSLVLQF